MGGISTDVARYDGRLDYQFEQKHLWSTIDGALAQD